MRNRRQHLRRAQHVATGRGCDEASVECVQQCRGLAVLAEQLVVTRQLAEHVGAVLTRGQPGETRSTLRVEPVAHERLQRRPRGRDAVGRIGHGGEQVDAFLHIGRAADDVQAVRDHRVL